MWPNYAFHVPDQKKIRQTMQAFFVESTFPKGEGYFWIFRRIHAKSEFT